MVPKFQEFRWQVEKFVTSKILNWKRFYINDQQVDAWEAELPITSKVFSTAFVWKNKAYKIKFKNKILSIQAKYGFDSSWTTSEMKNSKSF
jgi:hypothetical protein